MEPAGRPAKIKSRRRGSPPGADETETVWCGQRSRLALAPAEAWTARGGRPLTISVIVFVYPAAAAQRKCPLIEPYRLPCRTARDEGRVPGRPAEPSGCHTAMGWVGAPRCYCLCHGELYSFEAGMDVDSGGGAVVGELQQVVEVEQPTSAEASGRGC